MISNVIFDFDGTLADTRELMIKVFNDLAPSLGFAHITDGDIEKFRDFGAKQFLSSLKINPLKMPFLVKDVRARLGKGIGDVKTFDGIADALAELKNSGLKLGILTSNSVENVHKFLDNNNLNYFDFVDSENDLFGKDKSLNTLFKKFNLQKSEVVYVGDETRDIEASKKAEIKIIAVTWGFNSEKALRQENPASIIDSPRKLLPTILNI